jgi:hypothetical protein
MLDPVIDAEGITYERHAITQWLENHTTDPTTRVVLVNHTLIPNVAIRSQVDDYVREHGVPQDWREYAHTIGDADVLVKLARLGIVTRESVSAVTKVYESKRARWAQLSKAFARAELRARQLEQRTAEQWKDLRETSNKLKFMREQVIPPESVE